jgi:paraquat-inducible protein B
MTENNHDADVAAEMAVPVARRRKSFPLVWLVPVVALLIGGWLAVKAISEKGPIITIAFKDANGLEAGKTQIKYKEVEIGKVKSIHFSEDASHVIVTAEMVKQAERFLAETTRFWVVRARVTGSEVSGLATLLSGAYIAVDPGKEGTSVRHFKGLETAPVVTTDLPGRHFHLKARQLGSLDYGSPVYYRQIKVGEVEGVSLDDTGETVMVQVFVEDPYHQFVRQNTRFWLSSGLELEISAQGVRMDTESLVSLMIGGIAFGVLDGDIMKESADAYSEFRLYDNYAEAQKRQYEKTGRYLLYFNESVRGLSIGAPVEFRGIQIGEVVDINLESGAGFEVSRIAVAIDLELERCGISVDPEVDQHRTLAVLVEKGLRAQLEIGSLLTGQLYVALDYYPDAPEPQSEGGQTPVIPTVPAELEEIITNAGRFIARLNNLPVEDIGKNLNRLAGELAGGVDATELRQAVKSLDGAMQAIRVAADRVNNSTLPAMDNALAKLDNAVEDLEKLVDADAPLQYELRRALEEFASAARAVRGMADTIERKPESLIRGK